MPQSATARWPGTKPPRGLRDHYTTATVPPTHDVVSVLRLLHSMKLEIAFGAPQARTSPLITAYACVVQEAGSGPSQTA